jgi:membrane protease YdiL (CAAX protease family)
MSLFHSFRSAVESRDDFKFLPRKAPSQLEILTSPFNFSYLKQAEVTVPLAMLAIYLGYWVPKYENARYSRPSFGGTASAFFTSHMAGTWEELAFRGWLMPVFRQMTGNDGWANGLQASLFGLAHWNETSFPLTQFLGGMIYGYSVIQNDWDIRVGVFQHFWWDFLIFMAIESSGSDVENIFYLPAISMTF